MSNQFTFDNVIPIGPLKLITLEGARQLTEEVDKYIVQFRKNDANELKKDPQSSLALRGYDADSYLLESSCPRFGSGEAKGILHESARGADVYIIGDVTNYSLTYSVCGHTNHMSPDDHFQDLKRLISISVASAKRVTVILPFLYESRQHKRTKRESLDSAMALEELVSMGVKNIITFDAHDPRVQNAIPLHGFDNFQPPYQFMKALLKREKNLIIDKEHLMVISPDEGAMARSVYFANNLGVDMGMFYKRRDYSRVVNGRNPIVAHEFLGSDVKGKTVIIIDDMISSGESMLDTARELKERGAERVIICCTFGLFTNGFDMFDEYHDKGIIDYVITTNLNYRPDELFTKPWYIEANMSKFLAAIINTLNHDSSVAPVIDPTPKIQKLIAEYNKNRM
jgi:ribose-phosphate pyrophosphokinase